MQQLAKHHLILRTAKSCCNQICILSTIPRCFQTSLAFKRETAFRFNFLLTFKSPLNTSHWISARMHQNEKKIIVVVWSLWPYIHIWEKKCTCREIWTFLPVLVIFFFFFLRCVFSFVCVLFFFLFILNISCTSKGEKRELYFYNCRKIFRKIENNL